MVRMSVSVCLLILYLVAVRGPAVCESRITRGLPVPNISSIHPVKEQVVQAVDQNPGKKAGNRLTQSKRTSRDVPCQADSYFQVGANLCCRNCPAGTRVAKACTEDKTSGKCEPCIEGQDYTEFENGLDKCLTCERCREDQELVSNCTAQRNTVCQCKAGSFCIPNRTCEMCRKCKTDCGDDQTVAMKCNATSDTVCDRTVPPTAALSRGVTAMIVVVIIVLIILCLIYYYHNIGCSGQWHVIISVIDKWLHRTDSADSASDPVAISVVNESCLVIAGGGGVAPSVANENTDNAVNEQAQNEKVALLMISHEASEEHGDEGSVQSPCHDWIVSGSPSDLGGDPSQGQMGLTDLNDLLSGFNLNPLHNCESTGDEKGTVAGTEDSFVETISASSLVQSPPPGPYKQKIDGDRCFRFVNEPRDIKDLIWSFDSFLKEVPMQRWKEFMRKLDLTENEIVEAERNNINDIREGHFQMLHTWLQKSGFDASVNTLLTTLYYMELKAAAHTIEKTLNKRESEAH